MRRPSRHESRSAGREDRRGSVYIAVLGTAMVIAICALGGMHLARSELKGTRRSNDLQRARRLAKSAVELAVASMNRTPLDNNQWRTGYTSGVETSPVTMDGGTLSFKVVDEDGDLADDPTDAIWVYGYGRSGEAVWIERAWVRNDRGPPLEALNTCLHSSGELQVGPADTLTVSGAPVSTDGNLKVDGAIVGNAHAVTRTGTGTISGTATVPAERKGVPWPSVFDDYVAKATPITYSANMAKFVLAPGVNQCGGGLNPDGLYYLTTTNRPVIITDARIHGTLIINSGTGNVSISGICSIQPYRPDFPALIIKGATTLALKSDGSSQFLSEATAGHNFNPDGAPYQGSTDSDTADSYPSEIRGLVHIIGATSFQNAGRYRGAILVQGAVTVSGSNPTTVHDRALIMNPPWGYSSTPNSSTMVLQAQTWTRQPLP